MKIYCLLLIAGFVVSEVSAQAQSLPDANTVLKAVYRTISDAHIVSYKGSRHFYYRNDNYRSNDTFQIIFQYNNRETAAGLKYQVRDIVSGKTYIYNGVQSFTLDEKTRALDVDAARAKDNPPSMFFFRQSWANLYNMLPVIIQSDSVIKSVDDTLIARKNYYRVGLFIPRKRLAALNGFTALNTDTIQWKYELVVDKTSMLPFQFNVRIETPGNQDDHIRATFEDIRVNGRMPKEGSWFFSTYRKRYPYYTAKRNEVVKAGSLMGQWKLPVYHHSSVTDTLHSEELKGKVTLYKFWIRSCSYCMAALPHLNNLQNMFKKELFQLITINCYDTKEEVGFFHQKYSPDYIMCYNGLQLAEKLGIYAYPMTLLVDSKGVIVNVSEFDKEALIKKIREVLNEGTAKDDIGGSEK